MEGSGERSLGHGVLESWETFSTKKRLLRSRLADLWLGGDLMASWLVMQQLGSSAGTVGSSSASPSWVPLHSQAQTDFL